MAHKQLLHELLKEDQEPFHLKTYIDDRRSQMKQRPSPAATAALHLRRSKPVATKQRGNNLCKHACFLSFHHSPDIRRSPFLDFPSPAKSPSHAAVFLHIPSRTAAVLVEAAMRIQKQPKSPNKSVGFGLFGSLLKRLKDRSKNRKRAIEGDDFKFPDDGNATTLEQKVEESVRISCSCSNWTENNEDKSLDFEASTSSRVSECSEQTNDDFDLRETCFCSSPFRFSLHRSPSSAGLRTPEFCSPAASPSRHVQREKENYESRKSDNVQAEEEEEEKEQCSPVSVLDPPFEDDGRESGDAEEDDYDLECSYENVQRAKQQLLYRLRRFERLAELDPIELERKLMEGSSDDEGHAEREESEDDEPLSLYKKHSVETFVTQVFNQSSFQYHTRSMSTDMKRLVSDLIVEERSSGMSQSGSNEVVVGRICNRLDLWKDVEFNTIDMMVGLDFKREFDGWTKFAEQVEETAAEIELAVYELLVEELSDDLFYSQETDMVSC